MKRASATGQVGPTHRIVGEGSALTGHFRTADYKSGEAFEGAQADRVVFVVLTIYSAKRQDYPFLVLSRSRHVERLKATAFLHCVPCIFSKWLPS